MHNLNYIRENPIEFDNAMKLRGENPISSKILEETEYSPLNFIALSNSI